jgi:hypothetical protein
MIRSNLDINQLRLIHVTCEVAMMRCAKYSPKDRRYLEVVVPERFRKIMYLLTCTSVDFQKRCSVEECLEYLHTFNFDLSL